MKVGTGSFILGFFFLGGGEAVGGYHMFPIFCSVFMLLLVFLSYLVHHSKLCFFHCSFFAFFLSGTSN